jgi:aryl-alcohol dehydrogenase-like predicted oxidoreductase
MRYRALSGTDRLVSEVGFGVWTVSAGWWGDYTDEQSIALLRRGFDLGINYFDTADTYGNGRGETLLAEAFAGRRDQIVINTKFGYDASRQIGPRGQRELPQDWSPAFVRAALEQSLRRLNTDYIDCWQMHNPKMDAIERDDVWQVLADLQREGKVLTYGVALGPRIGWREEGLRALHERRVPNIQIIHNLLEQEPGADLIAAAREIGADVIVRVPHSSGLLEGNLTADTVFPPTDHRSHRPKEWLTEGLVKVEQLRFLEAGGRRTLGQAALKWLLADPLIITTLPNVYDAEQLADFAAAPDVPDLTDEEMRRVQELYDANFGLTPAAAAGAGAGDA